MDFNNNVRPFGWNNIIIEVQANTNPDTQAPNTRYLDDIRVTLTVGYKSNAEGGVTFYQAEATLVTVKTGKTKRIAFWMPYDVVERDNLPKEPDYWLVEMAVKGQDVDLRGNRKSYSSSFSQPGSIDKFKSMSRSGISETEGIMVPTYLSPNPYVDREPPAFIRKEQN